MGEPPHSYWTLKDNNLGIGNTFLTTWEWSWKEYGMQE